MSQKFWARRFSFLRWCWCFALFSQLYQSRDYNTMVHLYNLGIAITRVFGHPAFRFTGMLIARAYWLNKFQDVKLASMTRIAAFRFSKRHKNALTIKIISIMILSSTVRKKRSLTSLIGCPLFPILEFLELCALSCTL